MSGNKISILIPTRKRPNNISRILQEFNQCTYSNLELILGIDEDDDSYDNLNLLDYKFIKIIRTPKIKYLSNLYNIMFEYSTGDIIGYFADDNGFVNLNRLDDICAKFQDTNAILYSFETTRATHGFISRKSIETLGFMFPPNLEHGYMDWYLDDLYKSINRYFVDLNPFYIHLHPTNTLYNIQIDETYLIKSHLVDSAGMKADDRDFIKYLEYKNNLFEYHQNLLKSLIYETV